MRCLRRFNLAESWGLRAPASNPCRHLKRYPERKRKRYLGAEELQRLGAALVEADGVTAARDLAADRANLLWAAGRVYTHPAQVVERLTADPRASERLRAGHAVVYGQIHGRAETLQLAIRAVERGMDLGIGVGR